MFALILTIISIALVALLAIATLYYGGDALNRGPDTAAATKIRTQGEQLLGATELYRADHGSYPTTLGALLSENYLKEVPVAQFRPDPSLISAAYAAEPWTMRLPLSPMFVLPTISDAVCQKVNQQSYQVSEIRTKLRTDLLVQCAHINGSNKVVVTYHPDEIPMEFPTDWENPGPSVSSALTFSAPSYAFGPHSVGTSTQQDITVTNGGTTDLSTPAISAVGAGFSVAHNCPATLAAGSSCVVSASFSPLAVQAYSGHISVGYATTPSTAIPLTGSGVSTDPFTVSTNNLNLGNREVGDFSQQTVTITNVSLTDLTTPNLAVSGSSFSQTSDCPASLAPTESCQSVITFAPTAAQPYTGTLSVGFGSTPATLAVSLQGVGRASTTPTEVGFGETFIEFGPTPVGTTAYLPQHIYVNGAAPLRFGPVPFTVPAPFFIASNTCPSVMQQGEECEVVIGFSPPAAKVYPEFTSVNQSNASYLLVMDSNAVDGSGRRFVLSLSGLGTPTMGAYPNALLPTGSQGPIQFMTTMSFQEGDWGYPYKDISVVNSAGDWVVGDFVDITFRLGWLLADTPLGYSVPTVFPPEDAFNFLGSTILADYGVPAATYAQAQAGGFPGLYAPHTGLYLDLIGPGTMTDYTWTLPIVSAAYPTYWKSPNQYINVVSDLGFQMLPTSWSYPVDTRYLMPQAANAISNGHGLMVCWSGEASPVQSVKYPEVCPPALTARYKRTLATPALWDDPY